MTTQEPAYLLNEWEAAVTIGELFDYACSLTCFKAQSLPYYAKWRRRSNNLFPKYVCRYWMVIYLLGLLAFWCNLWAMLSESPLPPFVLDRVVSPSTALFNLVCFVPMLAGILHTLHLDCVLRLFGLVNPVDEDTEDYDQHHHFPLTHLSQVCYDVQRTLTLLLCEYVLVKRMMDFNNVGGLQLPFVIKRYDCWYSDLVIAFTFIHSAMQASACMFELDKNTGDLFQLYLRRLSVFVYTVLLLTVMLATYTLWGYLDCTRERYRDYSVYFGAKFSLFGGDTGFRNLVLNSLLTIFDICSTLIGAFAKEE